MSDENEMTARKRAPPARVANSDVKDVVVLEIQFPDCQASAGLEEKVTYKERRAARSATQKNFE